jgi:hypothetical protein
MAMSEKATATAKTTEIKKANSGSQSQRTQRFEATQSPMDQILFFQRTIGNQAVQRLFKSGHLQAKLRIGQPNDVYEQEADRVAEQVMRMPDGTVSGKQSAVSSEGEFDGRRTADGGRKNEFLQLKPG